MKVSFKQFSNFVDADESNLSEEQLNELWPFGNGEAKAKADAAKEKALADQQARKDAIAKKERERKDAMMQRAGKAWNATPDSARKQQAQDRTADIGGIKFESLEEILIAVSVGDISINDVFISESELADEAQEIISCLMEEYEDEEDIINILRESYSA